MNQDVLCFSHLRWNFVFQRPNHLMVRCARDRRVFFIEEPIAGEHEALSTSEVSPNLFVVQPTLTPDTTGFNAELVQRRLLRQLMREHGVVKPIVWFYTPMAMPLAEELQPSLVVYDCMDELSLFQGAPPELLQRERALFGIADLVFTGGQSLYESKRAHHPSVHAFPSSVDAEHFGKARAALPAPTDQAPIPGPRVGYFGVIDERLDLRLLERAADERPSYQFVMVGPVVKIDAATLPRRANLHYLGGKKYQELPAYLAGWDVAMMPFALNDATRFISPTKTLEYLAAGKPIVSTAIRDVITPYGKAGSVQIADAGSFALAIDRALTCDLGAHLALATQTVQRTSWDRTWADMSEAMAQALQSRTTSTTTRLRTEEEACSTI